MKSRAGTPFSGGVPEINIFNVILNGGAGTMYAENADALRRLIENHTGEPPSVFLRDDSLASFLYDRRTVRELKSAFHRDADADECRRWRLSAEEWREQVAMAMIAAAARQRKHGR